VWDRLRVLLVYPRLKAENLGGWDPPLGILYLATYLQKRGIECDVIDATFMRDWTEFENALKRSKQPDVIGLSFSSPIAHMGFQAAALVKKIFPKSFVVAGGPHPTVAPLETVSNGFIDAIVLGEGEITLERLVKSLSKGLDLSMIPNLWYKKGGQIIQNQTRLFVQNLDDLPYPDWKFLDLRRYIEVTGTIPIHAIRGCPFNCFFCQPTQRKMFGAKLRARSPKSIVNEMSLLNDKYGKKNHIFSFEADTLVISKGWIKEFCNQIRLNKLEKTPWVCQARVDTINEEIINDMKNAGCIMIAFGAESGSQRILNLLNKGITTEQTEYATRLCSKKGIICSLYFMIGSPTETREDLEKTCEFIRRTRPDFISISRTTPMLGSSLYDYALQKGMLNINDFSQYDYYSNMYPMSLEHLKKDDLQYYYDKMMRIWMYSMIRSFPIKFFKIVLYHQGSRFFLIRYGLKKVKSGKIGKFFKTFIPSV
jgi:radical SAM superfamily enzyme YgiQ (UPF0313 family)